MKKDTLHNTRRSRQFYTGFLTLKDKIQSFGGVFIVQITVFTLLISLFFSGVESVQSKRQLPVTFGSDVALNIFPTEVKAGDWSGVEHVLIQDLRDDSLYQVFSARNSAYVPQQMVVEPEPQTVSDSVIDAGTDSATVGAINTSDTSSGTDSTDETFTENNVSTSTTTEAPVVNPSELMDVDEVPTTPSDSEPETGESTEIKSDSDAHTSSTQSVSILKNATKYFSSAVTLATRLFPLASLSTTTPATSSDDLVNEDTSVESDQNGTTDTTSATSASSVPVTTAIVTTTPTTTSLESTTTTTTTTTTSEVLTNTDNTLTSESVSSSDATTTVTNSNAPTELTTPKDDPYEITLQNFEVPPLESGQFVTGMQLRISLAAKLEKPVTDGSVPYVEILFGTATSMEPVGIVTLEDEISNAINGGYFLFALPETLTVKQLSDQQVTLRYHGDADALDGMFLDAAWLELQTKVVTETDIAARGKSDNLKHLSQPKFTTLISEKLNFRRDELPIFNLKYASQENSLVRGIRNLFGQNAVAIKEVEIRHRSFGLLGIEPKVTITKEGLLTIEIPEEIKQNLRPGEYEVQLTLQEGGKEYIDTFNFQWGILTINPHKSEYESGETATISIGALTPSGHTICKANFALYITDPLERVSRVSVTESGLCDGNNVIDEPDFTAQTITDEPGEYDLYLERLDDAGNVLSFTNDTFLVSANQRLSIERDGPTRIYPLAPYLMELTVESKDSFTGVLTERVPKNFKISATSADISLDGDWQILTWDISLLGAGEETVQYQFDAPDISPYLYTLGPASLTEEQRTRTVLVASTTASSTEEETVTEGGALFTEHRQWQIASDAVGKMLLLWDDGATLPTDWICVSCTAGDPFFDRFIMGSSTYNAIGGTATHTHSADGTVFQSSDSATESGTGGIAPVGHNHTYDPVISTDTNEPPYRQLRVIQYDAAAGEPATIPAGAIGIFDVASSSLPTNWNRYAVHDGWYVRGANTPATTGGTSTHSHTISGATGVSSGAGTNNRGGPSTADGATDTHTHTVSSSTAEHNHEPPYVEVLLAELSTDDTPPNGLIAMWTEDVGSGWIDVSSDPGDTFANKFFKASTTYGTTGGAATHAHANVTGILSSVPSATTIGRTGTAGADGLHQHDVDVTNFSTANNLPPYATAVFGKRLGTDPVYTQQSFRWYVNENAVTPTDPWPTGVTDLLEGEAITSTSTPVADNERLRLRVNVGVTNATSTAGATFKLQYAAAAQCSSASGWATVGDTSSSTIWRGYNNSSVADHSTLPSTVLASSTVLQTYEENGYATNTPNNILVDEYGEWDFVLEQNDAEAGTQYCFRLVENDGTAFLSYANYPQLTTNEAPNTPTLEKLFDNEKVASTSPHFQFVATDPEGEDIHYEIEVDTDTTFASPVIERDTISDVSLFENQVLTSDKAPFNSGELIQFIPATSLTNGTTYYWRVRGSDPDGSDKWGEWSTAQSFTIDTSLTASAWYQTEDEQFSTNTLEGLVTGTNELSLATGSSTGTSTSTRINFTDGSIGTAWDSLVFNDTETNGDISYQVEYLTDSATWEIIPDSALAGNSTGFDTSPVSLLTLDVDTYGTIRLVAKFTDVGGSPSLQDWQVNWGYRVETPTITKLFPSEQVGTTTPTFEFTTIDPQSDDLTYQIQWSQTPDFAASTTRTSDTDAGFTNLDTGADTDPFNSGEVIQFTIEPADALTSTTTYWWRVRAKDTTGDNAYSFWTEERSLTVINGTDVSTWYQTTAEQFDTNILSGTKALPSGAVTVATTASEAILVYGEGTEDAPRYRQWNGSSWGDEGLLQDVGAPTRWAVVEAGTTREEYVAVTVGTDGDVNAQVFSTGVWDNLVELTTTVGDATARGFDVAYETLSGDAMVAYCDGDSNPSYSIWNGTTWATSSTITTNTTGNCAWLELEADPTSNEIVIVSRDSTGSEYEGQVWNGTSWGNASQFGQSYDSTYSGIALSYEESGDQAVAVAPSPGGGPNRMVYNTWNGTTWSGETTQTIDGRLYWGELSRNVGTDDMVLCYQNDNNDVQAIRWTGAAWTGDTEFTATANADTDPGFSCAYEDTSGRDDYIIGAYSDTAQTSYRIWNAATWSGATQINTIGDSATMQLERTGVADILGVFFDDPNDSLRFSSWDGSSWSGTETLEENMSVDSSPFGRPYALSPRNSGSEGTTIVSPGIDFDDGLGPYWQRFSWTDTTPGTSEILYQVQYQTATGSWAFIPDGDLPGNSNGTSTSPIDLSNLNTNTYNVIRPYATLSCDVSDNCPTIADWRVEWAGGITISGTIQDYNRSVNVDTGTVAVAVNGTLQTGKVGTISSGAWSISNVTTFPGDVVTVFVSDAATSSEAVAVTRYDGTGDMTGVALYERHLSLGSDDATTTPLTNAEIGAYNVTNDEDVFISLASSTLEVCGDVGCGDARLFINASTTYSPGGIVITHDFINNGTVTVGAHRFELHGSWDNNATTTLTNSTVVFAATSSTESIDSTGASVSSFNHLTFGTTTGSGTWTLESPLDVNGDFLVARGTLARGTTSITIAGDLTTGANGFWSGVGTTTFDGGSAATWADQNSTLQNVGQVLVDGTSKSVTLAGNVAAESITIGTNDTLDASVGNYDLTVYGDWKNQNNFIARNGTVFFTATSTGNSIATAADAFYDLTFNGVGGGWSFTESTLFVNNDFTISTGTVNLPANGTSTIAGSFDATGGSFAHNNSVLYFTANTAETITFDGDVFTNVTRNLTFNGGGSWIITDTNATSTDDITVMQGAVTFPSGTLAVGGTLTDNGGSFIGGSGTVRFYSSVAEVITTGGSSFGTTTFDGSGSWSFAGADMDVNGNFLVEQGTVTTPSGTLTIGGSYDNNSTVIASVGTVVFDSNDSGETINFGASSLYNVIFDGATGGWTLTAPATTTNNFSLTNASDWTLTSGDRLSVAGTFTNQVGGASTTWVGSTLALEAGAYSVNGKTDAGDAYGTLQVAADTDIALWNSVASSYTVDATGSLYSQDHNAVDGDLYIFGNYQHNDGNEYWSYATDFDGTDLATTSSERQVDVRFSSGASASFGTSTLEVVGAASASTTIQNQGAGTYTVTVTGGTTTAQYYEFADLGSTGISLLGGAIVPTLRDGSYTVAAPGGSALTLSSSTIDANPAKQIFNIAFATSTAIAANNVTQSDGTPSSYWWFREGGGNLYGEGFDNDTGDPGSVRFDDSSLIITISGTVYDSSGAPLTGGTCDGSTPVVRVMINGAEDEKVSCSNVDGSYSASGVTVIGDPTVTVYLDNASGGEQGSVLTRTPTADITDMHIRVNRVIVRNEDTEPLTIANLAVYDSSDDPADLAFTAATSTGDDTLLVHANNGLLVSTSSTFTPGGVVTLAANSNTNGYDGTLFVNDGATFNTYSTSTLTIGGRLVLSDGSNFNAASSTVLMNATTTGKSITAPDPLTLHNLTFNGVGGGWNVGADMDLNGDMTIINGTVTGTGNITLLNGSLTGNGILSLGGGTTTIAASNTLGGTSAWTFYNLQLGDGVDVGTTTPIFSGTTTVAGRLTIAAAHFLDAGNTSWDLSGTGQVFVEQGTFQEDTSTIRYSGAGANMLSTQYHNLNINAGVGSETYTVTGLGAIIDGNLTVGGQATSTLDLDTNDPALDVNGDVTVRTNGTLLASDSAQFTIAGSYSNTGAFSSNSGLVTFDGSGLVDIAAGSSDFSNVTINAAGDVTISSHATATASWTLSNANTFTLNSGQTLAVGGIFYNDLGGVDTTWSGTTLRLYGGGDYSINAATTSDAYETLAVVGGTQIRSWNLSANTYAVDSTASLYSRDHAGIDGNLFVWGDYRKSNAADYWSYATDFDGSDLGGGSERKVDVYFSTSSSVTITGGLLAVIGTNAASTTLQSQGTGSYSFTLGGSASGTLQYYEVRDVDSSGLVFSGSPDIATLSNGDYAVSQNGGTAMTVGGTVIDANPAKNFTGNRFALSGVASGSNVTATGTSASSWRFANHTGGRDGEAYDIDPDGDPGYIAWDDSAALITVSGTVYADEGATVSSVCDGITNNVTLRVAGITTYNTSCDGTTGVYSISNVSYGSSDALVVYIDGEAESAATVTADPVSNINNLNLYENRVIVRHENTNPLTIADMAVWDSSDDSDIPFTAADAAIDSLTLPADHKLIVWGSKNFAPGGDVTLSGGGAGAAYDGTLELYNNAVWTGANTELLSVGGSFVTGVGATFTPSNGTTTFTTTGASRTVDVNEQAFNNLVFAGTGSWSVADATLTSNGYFRQSAGSLTLPGGTTTVSGSFVVTGGSFDSNNGLLVLDGVGSNTVTLGGSTAAELRFAGATYTFGDTNATATRSVLIESGSVTLPSGSFSVGGDFRNIAGSITHNTSLLRLTATTSASVLASSSDLYSVTFAGGGAYQLEDVDLALLDTFTVASGSVTLASGILSLGGSFDATGGIFDHATGTVLFNSADSGETIEAGSSNFYNVQVSAPSGGYTLIGAATTSNHFTLASASTFAAQSGSTVVVKGVFSNDVGGASTTWSGSTLVLAGQNAYTVNSKTLGADQYDTLEVQTNSNIRLWNSAATTTTVAASASLYSQDHAGVDGSLYIYGDFQIATTTEHWSYATDFDGTDLSGGDERAVTAALAAGATSTLSAGSLQLIGANSNETTVTNQGSGTYSFAVTGGTFTAQYYAYRNLNGDGLQLSGTPTISSLSYGDFELGVSGGTLITLASTTLNANASLVIPGNRFATTTAITGTNVTLSGSTSNAWTYTGHTGNLDGEDFDSDGPTACGSLRWNDSSCLLTQQTNFRWRNDDGGLGVPDSEWYNASWDARKFIRVENVDATTYSNPAVQIIVNYDADMQTDFDDLRFTDADGTTLIPHWIGSSTDSTVAEIWVQVPALPADDTANIFMYYNNPTATTTSSSTEVFTAADDFEDNTIVEYSGQTSLFNVGTNFPFDGTYGLDNTGNESSRATLGGMFRFDQTVSQGETFRYLQYVDTADGSSDETCTLFGVQSPGTTNQNYAVCIEQFGTDRISLVRDVVDNDASGTILASSTVAFTTGWYEVEVDWGTDDSLQVALYDNTGSLAASISATDSTYTAGGYGFTFWFHNGGWDSVSSRPLLTTEPTVRFGVEQTDGGASWKAAQNVVGIYDVGDVARLRVSVENSGLGITDQEFLLEYAPLDTAPSCESVASGEYTAVPPQSACGTSPVCMATSSSVTNGASTVDLLTDVAGDFVIGEAREDPSNSTGNLDIAQNEYTELEYAISPTNNVVDEQLCFRVTDNGTPIDTYLEVAELNLRFDPVLSAITLNNGQDISLVPGTTTAVYATGTVSDLNGYADLTLASSTMYRSGVSGGALCTADNNDCYISTSSTTCSFTDCAGNSCTIECRADVFFHADPTDSGSVYEGQEWLGFMEVEDASGGYDFSSTPGVEVSTLRAIDVDGQIDYGTLAVNDDTGSYNASTSVLNQGNVEIDLEITGSDLSDGISSTIPADQQKFATSTFTYSACGSSCGLLSSTTPVAINVDLTKPSTDTPPVSDEVYWGIAVPFGVSSVPHQGTNVFTPVSP